MLSHRYSNKSVQSTLGYPELFYPETLLSGQNLQERNTYYMGNILVFPEIHFPDPELNFLHKTYDLLYKFPRLSGNQKT